MKTFKLDWLVLPLIGMVAVLALWQISCMSWAKDLPTPAKTWEASKPYIVEPFAKRGEMDQGILRFTWYSLTLVAKGYTLALIIGTPIGFLLGLSKTFTKIFDPLIQILRPVSPLAWLPLGLVLFMGAGKDASELGALFTIAICSMMADGAEHGGGRAGHSAGLPECGQGVEIVAPQDALQSAHPGGAAVHVHGLSVEPGHCLAGDCGGGDAHGAAGRGRLSLAGIQRAHL